jgi:hypothetical protein
MALHEVRINGIDVTDRPIQFGRQSFSDVEVVLTDRLSTLTGSVIDARDRPVSRASVVIYPADRARRYPESRFVARVVTDTDGRFSTVGLPEGTYYVAAVSRLPDDGNGWKDPQYLQTLDATATTVSLAETGTSTVRLRLNP